MYSLFFLDSYGNMLLLFLAFLNKIYLLFLNSYFITTKSYISSYVFIPHKQEITIHVTAFHILYFIFTCCLVSVNSFIVSFNFFNIVGVKSFQADIPNLFFKYFFCLLSNLSMFFIGFAYYHSQFYINYDDINGLLFSTFASNN
mgnify:CR=1 FL=1